MKSNQLTPSEAITIIRILNSLADECYLYEHDKERRDYYKQISKKLEKFL